MTMVQEYPTTNFCLTTKNRNAWSHSHSVVSHSFQLGLIFRLICQAITLTVLSLSCLQCVSTIKYTGLLLKSCLNNHPFTQWKARSPINYLTVCTFPSRSRKIMICVWGGWGDRQQTDWDFIIYGVRRENTTQYYFGSCSKKMLSMLHSEIYGC